MSTQSILGLFHQAEPAADAMDGLKEAGFKLGTFDVLTGTPYPEGAFGEHVPQHRLFRFPAFGAIIGFTLSVFLTAVTQLAYPMVTGGKPILSVFAMLIIMYEMTMLSGVIATVVGIVFESRLPNMKPGIYDTRITEGWIGVVVTFDDDSKVADAESVLNKAGAVEIKHA
ncbi:MAG: DUF3341 domain-containing protein [Dehalococcoidia bacterium]|jgi:hypothetical protein|nr:hypothetical protein [Chloroflexota bacterium]MDP6056343.1 DUF3341 domain-containing protein [Dehalococcoidia bacterium]MDP7090608.1 DUF3341 domain-containing protein [Dehalococcoidia bacterium]MDP7262090.1 DUF3341 domain-containing protein [Dehalococcoidia bacterium]MDP7484686.1 DUF3341 domain-containing protein [Dehalococcoidia bacterium]|tara:strand:+ start:3964 stop:4473 length:510 start_codon:yes stop_codon:yes gene_type:complete